MKYIAAVLFVLVGLVELLLRGLVVLILVISIMGLFVLLEKYDPTELLEPISFKLAERCLA